MRFALQENGSLSLISALAFSDGLIKSASDAKDYNCKWEFSRIFFAVHHIREGELGAGIHRRAKTCISESLAMRFTQNRC